MHNLISRGCLKITLIVGNYDDTILGLIDQLAVEAHERGKLDFATLILFEPHLDCKISSWSLQCMTGISHMRLE